MTFNVRDGALQRAGPVDQSVCSVDGSVFVHADEGLRHGLAHLRVHGEARAVPVHRTAQATQLAVDGGSVLKTNKNNLLPNVQIDYQLKQKTQ